MILAFNFFVNVTVEVLKYLLNDQNLHVQRHVSSHGSMSLSIFENSGTLVDEIKDARFSF